MRALISAIEQRLDAPTSRSLVQAITRAMREGVVAPGERLPPIRELATQLNLSPTTVSSAWGVLTRAGSLRTDGRRGTFVAEAAAPREGRYVRALDRSSSSTLDLSTGVPDAALLPSLAPALASLTSAGTPVSYLDDPVLPDLRDLLLGDWPYPPPSLTIVDGAMDGLELVIRSCLRFGDRVLVESPTFPPLLDLLEASGMRVHPVAMDDRGISFEGVRQALAEPVQAVFLQPSAHNPTGVSMTASRRDVLAELLRTTNALLVEDDSASALANASTATLGVFFPERTVHIRSFSKSHGPDLRLAALSGPEDVVAQVQRIRHLGQGWSSRLLQRVLHGLLTNPQAQAQVEAARVEYRRRRDLVVAALRRRGLEIGGSDGLNIWVPVVDETSAVMHLALHGIAVAPGRPFHVDSVGMAHHIRVTTGLVSEDHDEIGALIAHAATIGSWPSNVR